MQAKHALIQVLATAALALVSAAAMADDVTIDTERSVSTMSRAEVRAQVAKARTDHALLPAGEFTGSQAAVPRSASITPMSRDLGSRGQIAKLYLPG